MKRFLLYCFYSSIAAVATAQTPLSDALDAAGFQQNIGQVKDQFGNTNAEVKYQFGSDHFNLSLKENSFSYSVLWVENHQNMDESGSRHPDEDLDNYYNQNPFVHISRVDVTLPGCNPHPQIVTGEANGTYFNYYLNLKEDKPYTQVQCFNRVMYKDIYPNIDLLFMAGDPDANATIEYEWVLRPGADVRDIKMAYSGTKGMIAKDDGTIELRTTNGLLAEGALKTYTFTDESPVASSYQLHGNVLSYHLGSYDHSQTIVIDPTLMWGTFYGGELDETVFESEVVVDGNGKTITSGSTYSTTGIATTGAWDVTYSKFTDIFIVKFLTNSNNKISWGTYYGGKGKDGTFAVTVDHNNNIVIGGGSDTDSGMATIGSYKDTIYGNQGDLLLAEFKPNGTILWATYYGGSDRDHTRTLLVTKSNNILFEGYSSSPDNIPYGGYVYQSTYGGGGDVMLGEFNSTGWPIWVTYWGGSGQDRGHVMCFDTTQNYMYAVGTTQSNSGFIFNSPFQKNKGGVVDAYLSYWDTSGHYYWGTYVGGNYDDRGRGVNVDGAGNVYLAGYTQSTDSIASPGAHQMTWGGGYGSGGIPNDDGYLMKFDHSGHYKWGTYYGGDKEEFVRGMDIDSEANLYVIGDAGSTDSIATPDGYQNAKNGNSDNSDGMFMKWDSAGHQIWGSYLGSDKVDEGDDVFVYGGRFIYCILETRGQMPVSPDAYNFKNKGQTDIMIYKFEDGNFCYDQYEPNNKYKDGNYQIKAYDPGRTNVQGWSGSISSPTDQDWYFVKVKDADPNYMFILDNEAHDYTINILNKQGTLLGASTQTGTTPDTVILNGLTQAKYYIGIVHDSTQYDSAACYRLRVYKLDAPFKLDSGQPATTVQRSDIFVFPNPVSNQLNVNLLSHDLQTSDIFIYDLTGRIVYHSTIDLGEGYQQFNVPVAQLQSGAYQLVISNGSRFWQQAFVKQ